MGVYILCDNYWWELAKIKVGSRQFRFRCLNAMGAGFDLDEKSLSEIIKKHKTAIADKLCDLDWNGTDVYDNERFNTGWLDTEGNFYGCSTFCHLVQAELLHKTSERALELLGWVKLTYNQVDKIPFIYYEAFPNNKQVEWLKSSIYWNDDLEYFRKLHFIKQAEKSQKETQHTP